MHSGAQATLEAVRISGNLERGLQASGTKTAVTATGLLVDGTLPSLSDGSQGQGITVQLGASATLQRVRLSYNCASGLTTQGAGTYVTVMHALIDHTLPEASGDSFAAGIVATEGAQVSLVDARLSANYGSGLHILGKDSAVGGQYLAIDATKGTGGPSATGEGAVVADGAGLWLSDTHISANQHTGLVASGANTILSATRVLVEGTQPSDNGGGHGTGMVLQLGASGTLEDVRLSGNRELGLLVDSEGTALVATRLIVDGTLPRQDDQRYGIGVLVETGAAATMDEGRLSANRYQGLYISDRGTSVRANRLLVDGTQPQVNDLAFGRGIGVQSGSALDLQASRLVGNFETGLAALGNALVFLTGVVIEGTQPRALDNTGGAGMWLAGSSAGTVSASVLRANHGAALAVNSSLLSGQGVALLGTEWGESIDVDASGVSTGKTVTVADGLLLSNSAGCSLGRSLVAGNGRAGIVADTSPQLHIAHTLVNAKDGLFGLVLQHNSPATVDASWFSGASQQNQLVDQGLTIQPPPPLVQAPASDG